MKSSHDSLPIKSTGLSLHTLLHMLWSRRRLHSSIILLKTLHLLREDLGFCSYTQQLRTVLYRSGSMGVVILGRPACGLPAAPAFARLTTEARVQHKAVKRMTRNRPIKVRLLLCRKHVHAWVSPMLVCLHQNISTRLTQKQLGPGHYWVLTVCVHNAAQQVCTKAQITVIPGPSYTAPHVHCGVKGTKHVRPKLHLDCSLYCTKHSSTTLSSMQCM